ncbi:AAA family ATPase [Deinococcus aquiradiocola]|uniref:Chromosome partition protein Smc n=1 Tax=Deinococcus aquiradiocola TaxID=393059 RepID=A0A917P635_9DEIO|nr:chromosome segregation SMC family protein [Deinococcus aquiradiocola]GGJ63169.1 Smc1/Cut3/Cut14 family protein [Deinococcus aquiradiocola]
MITSITLQGFKSFADRTRLEFGPGVTAVIGPNGSGKSNVVEALRWVSHQARARELRAAKATELIFHGSAGDGGGPRAGKAALGLAEVQLELRTHAGERLHVSRRVYRDGSAEQDLMGRPARARDVQGALRGTGLGSGGLAVIGQGEVGSVVQAEGQTLLQYVQEAAGLSRSVAARQDTAAQLRAAETQLSQVRLLEEELEGRTARLRVAADAAVRHRALSLRQLGLQDALARARQLQTLDEIAALKDRVTELTLEGTRASQEVTDAAAGLDRARETVAEARAAQQAHGQALDLYRAAQQAHAQALAAHGQAERDLADVQAALRSLDVTPPERPTPPLDALSAEATGAARTLRDLQRQARELDGVLRGARDRANASARRDAARDAQRSTLSAEAERLRAALDAERAALDATQAEAARLAEVTRRLEDAHAQAAQRHAALLDRERSVRQALQAVNAELPPLRRELERLEGSLNSYARYAEGPRNALRSDHAGIVGSVADLLTVPAEHETAVGAALGRRLEQVVVATADDAREIIEILKRGGGRATFLPLDLLRPRPRRDAALLHERGVIGNLSDLCPSDPPIVGQNLLSDTLLMDSLASATALARRHANRPRLVTVDGELIEPGGALTGGRLRDSGAAVLADQRRFAEAQDEVEVLTQRHARLMADLVDLSGDVEDSATSESVARAARDAHRARERDGGVQLARLQASSASLEGQWTALQARLTPQDAQETAGTVDDGPDVTALEAQLDAVRLDAEHWSARERELNDALAAGRALEVAWRAHRDALARANDLHGRQATLSERQQALAAQLPALQAAVRARSTDLGALDPQALAHAEARRDAVSQAYAALIARQNRILAALEDARLTQARREGSLATLPDGTLPPGLPREWQATLTQTTRELESLGTVNASAADELAAEQARLDALTREREDVERAATELRQHLTVMDRAEQTATHAALTRVGQAFAEYSGELLGGQGELELEHDPDARLVGLKLAVQPKGKRTRSLNLLSAGERTMAGLAFLFALGHAPSDREGGAAGLPLAVLDEVDAPLDEANIRRFTRFLTLFAARGSQFLLVTHQKATMEVAGALWGVTTDGSGASRVLSIRQSDDVVPG